MTLPPNFFTEVIARHPKFSSPDRCADLALLEPLTREAVEAIIEDARELGVILMPWETYRSRQRQIMLFNQGATELREVGVHHYGLACDLVKSIGGDPSWKGPWDFLGVLAERHGLCWGGSWPHFKDLVHVQRIKVRDQPALFRGELWPGPTYVAA